LLEASTSIFAIQQQQQQQQKKKKHSKAIIVKMKQTICDRKEEENKNIKC